MEEPSEGEIAIFREMDERINMLPVLEMKENGTIQDLAEREDNNEKRVIQYLADKYNSTFDEINKIYVKVFVYHQHKGKEDAVILQSKLHKNLSSLIDEVIINYNTLGIIIWLKYQIIKKINNIPQQIIKDIITICSFFNEVPYEFEWLTIPIKYPKSIKNAINYPKIFQIELDKKKVMEIGEEKVININEIQGYIKYTDPCIRRFFQS